ncbi:methyltransferase domain-containing protein [Algoriphagus formosus]|uniref:methyltransferase domain-containing protein n=1 Tax=Algoriphagus formosus TaxID=2007308 RepID=UPI003F6FE1BE
MENLELLIDFHIDAERQGPGSDEDTVKALNLTPLSKQSDLKVADIGCGSGAQTLVLAKELQADITAVDLFPEFLEKLTERAKASGLEGKIKTLKASMEDLPFEKESLDLIWSEGAIYNMGFENGVKYWKNFLKKDGYLAASEITWLSESRPKEIEEHWNREYPEIGTASTKFSVLERNGFSPVGYFVLSEASWIDHYYQPMEKRFDSFLKKHQNSEDAREIVATEKDEIRKYKEYKDFLSYGFYIAKKIS